MEPGPLPVGETLRRAARTRRLLHGCWRPCLVAMTTPRLGHARARRSRGRSGGSCQTFSRDPVGLAPPAIYDASWNARANSAVGNPWMFTGQEYRQDLGMCNFKARFYSPDLGRFLQNDPIRFNGHDLNLYRYCLNDPINLADPAGTDWGDFFKKIWENLTFRNEPKGASGGAIEIGRSYPVGGGTIVVQTYKTFTGSKGLPAGNGGVLLVINYNAANEKKYQWIQVVTTDTLPNKDPSKTVPYVDQLSGAQGDYYYNQGSVDYIYKPGQAIFQDRAYGTGPGQLNLTLRLVDGTRNDATVYQFQWGFVYNRDGTVTAVPITGSAPGGNTP